MTHRPDIPPCPFCGSCLKHIGFNRHRHPDAPCLMSGRVIHGADLWMWRRRTDQSVAQEEYACARSEIDRGARRTDHRFEIDRAGDKQ